MQDAIHEAIALDGTAEDSPAARAAARRLFRRAGCDEDLAGDALLCLSELVTNALLHAGGAVCVELTVTPSHVRLEVSDGLPLHVPFDRSTGRGLAIVDQLSRAWGSFAADVGARPTKTVWAELESTSRPAAAGFLGEHGEREAVLLDVPIRLFFASEDHLGALLRDMQLLSAEWTSRHDTLVKGLADALRRNHEARRASREAVQRRLADGGDVITLRFPITADTPERARAFLDVVAQSEARTGRGDDATDPSAAELRHFRRWYAGELTHQALGGTPRRCPFRP